MSNHQWLWAAWTVLAFAWVLAFAVLETIALRRSDAGPTLSRFMWTLGNKWPPLIFLLGQVVGGLVVHFWWNWCPALGSTNG